MRIKLARSSTVNIQPLLDSSAALHAPVFSRNQSRPAAINTNGICTMEMRYHISFLILSSSKTQVPAFSRRDSVLPDVPCKLFQRFNVCRNRRQQKRFIRAPRKLKLAFLTVPLFKLLAFQCFGHSPT